MLLVGNNMNLIKEVKQKLSYKFDMKDIGIEHFIPVMEIRKNREYRNLLLSRQKNIEEIMKRFNRKYSNWSRSLSLCPKVYEEIEYMAHLPYVSVVGNLMYAMICT